MTIGFSDIDLIKIQKAKSKEQNGVFVNNPVFFLFYVGNYRENSLFARF